MWTGLAALVVAVLAWAIVRASGGSVAPEDDASVSLPGVYYPDSGRRHLQQGETYNAYSSNPPASGPHDPVPAPWGVNPNPVPRERIVHNLEHGGVAILYNCPSGCDEITGPLTDLVAQRAGAGRSVLLAPYPDMDSAIALVSWTRLDTFDKLDLPRVERFIEAHLCRFDPENICR